MNKLSINRLLAGAALGVVITACHTGNTSSGDSYQAPKAAPIPANYQCLATSLLNTRMSLKLAYASKCSVEMAIESQNLQAMAVALEIWNSSAFENDCTATPIQYNPLTGIGFIITAAHCIINASPAKPAGQKINPSYISIYKTQGSGHNNAWIYQGAKANPLNINDLTAQIMAAYIPTQFCETGILAGNACASPESSNGDIAILKINTQPGKNLSVMSNLVVAPANFELFNNGINNQLLALGYGTTNPNGQSEDQSNPYLFYINYQYYATNYAKSAFGSESPFPYFNAPSTILNGYSINNNSYTLICKGDSGGGDFAWDGSKWNLVGVHSWNYGSCGEISRNVNAPVSVSTDVRPFNQWIQKLLSADTQTEGCADLGDKYICLSGNGS